LTTAKTTNKNNGRQQHCSSKHGQQPMPRSVSVQACQRNRFDVQDLFGAVRAEGAFF
jgi:hypothetical protein